jgi:hypothetical protein
MIAYDHKTNILTFKYFTYVSYYTAQCHVRHSYTVLEARRQAICDTKSKLKLRTGSRGAIAIMFAQVGRDKIATRYLESLDCDAEIGRDQKFYIPYVVLPQAVIWRPPRRTWNPLDLTAQDECP